MATEYTDNFNLDLYTASDKPNLRDQYNAAMRKIDAALVGPFITSQIGDGSITSAKIADNAVTGAKLATNSVTNGKIANDAVTTEKINAGSVTTEKLADNSVTLDKLGTGIVDSYAIKTKSMNVAVIGDSWLDGYNGQSDPTQYYPFTKFFRDNGYFGHVYDYAQGGAGFYKSAGDYSKNFITLANELMASKEPEDIDIIIVVGGVNDIGQNESNVYNNVSTLVNSLRTYFTKAQIYVGCNITSESNLSHFNMMERIMATAAVNGAIPITGLYNRIRWISRWFTTDKYHLVDAGYKYFAACIYSFIVGADFPPIYYYSDFASEITTDVASEISSAKIVQMNDTVRIFVEFGIPAGTAASSYLFTMPPKRLPAVGSTGHTRFLSANGFADPDLYSSSHLAGLFRYALNQSNSKVFNNHANEFGAALFDAIELSWNVNSPNIFTYTFDNLGLDGTCDNTNIWS